MRSFGASLTDGPARACRDENPVPEHRRERVSIERLGLHPHNLLLAAGRLLPCGLFLDKTLAVLYSVPCHCLARMVGG